MAHKIIGDLAVTGTVTSQGNTVATSVNGSYADATGNITLDIYSREEILNMFSILPLTRYGKIDDSPITTTSTGFVFSIPEEVPVFMAGIFGTLAPYSIDLTSISSSAQNKTFYVYIHATEGLFEYQIQEAAVVESYTTCFVGTITTNTSQISTANIQKVSRLDIYRPSVTSKGSSFPVSTGLPNDPGTIGW